MKVFVFVCIFCFSVAGSAFSYADDSNTSDIRQEFESTFSNQKIYQAIQKYEPDQYEKLFNLYLKAKETNSFDKFNTEVSSYVNKIRNSHLKNSSDDSIFKFYRHVVQTGREIYTKDPDAAFSYVFGGDPGDYSKYVDLEKEMVDLGDLFGEVLSSSAAGRSRTIDQEEVENGMVLVLLGLYPKYGDRLALLQVTEPVKLSAGERSCLCGIFLDMYEEVFKLEPPTRDYVLRSFAASM